MRCQGDASRLRVGYVVFAGYGRRARGVAATLQQALADALTISTSLQLAAKGSLAQLSQLEAVFIPKPRRQHRSIGIDVCNLHIQHHTSGSRKIAVFITYCCCLVGIDGYCVRCIGKRVARCRSRGRSAQPVFEWPRGIPPSGSLVLHIEITSIALLRGPGSAKHDPWQSNS
jgi:hypothetical protein